MTNLNSSLDNVAQIVPVVGTKNRLHCLQRYRCINHVCENCLLYGAQKRSQLIDEETVQYVVEYEVFI